MHDSLKQLIVSRLDGDNVNAPWVWLVVAACDGPDPLAQQLGHASPPAKETPTAQSVAAGASDAPGAYLRSITVEGFRGIGPKATLSVTPGPGLTLVVGRNGSGKSSFAEALEFLLTGKSRRWDGRPGSAWREGWRNLHHPARQVSAEFHVEGTGIAVLSRKWAGPEAELEAHEATWQAASQPKLPLSALGWDGALAAYRPFLPYSELGDVLPRGPRRFTTPSPRC